MTDEHPVGDVSRADAASNARRARLRLMHLVEPQDTVGIALVAAFGPVRALEIATGRYRPDPEELREAATNVPGYGGALDRGAIEAAVRRWARRARDRTPENLESALARQGMWFVCPEDPDWPEGLRNLGVNQPLGLWGRGDRVRLAADCRTNIAFVGSRDATPYGESVTSHLAGDLAAEGYGVLSGGAFGIDAAAHRAALATSTRDPQTIAFLACGIDRFYPRAHEGLLREVAEHGLLVTEVPPGGSPMKHRFLQRNRLIAAMAEVTVVVEARRRSGALSTANHAIDQGKTVAVVPGSVFSAQSAGCHALLSRGPAELVTSTQDLRALLTAPDAIPGLTVEGPTTCDGVTTMDGGPSLTDIQKLVKEALPVIHPVPPDRLCAASGLSIREVLPALSRLEVLGLARRHQDGGWTVLRGTRARAK